MSDKTEPPTQRRMEEARKEGQVARSLELNSAVVLLMSAVLLRSQGSNLIGRVKAVMVATIASSSSAEVSSAWLHSFFIGLLTQIVPPLAILLLGIMVSSVAVTLAQTKFLFSTKKMKFDFKRLNPIDGLKRIFSKQGLVEFFKALLKLGLIGYVVYSYLQSNFPTIVETGQMSLDAGVARWGDLALNLMMRVGSVYIILAAADYGYQRWRFTSQLRMTKEEIKEELKRSEGDPFLRGRIRSQQRKIARTRMMSNVHKAKVVVTNPTHFAIALDYEPESMRAPRVLAKGAFHMAERIVEIAHENNIPIVQNIPLARTLYKTVEVDQEIPAELYLAVAEVLAYVFKLRKPAGLQPTHQPEM